MSSLTGEQDCLIGGHLGYEHMASNTEFGVFLTRM